ncbi:DUF465 domain-containing protein [Zymomonas mobilis subsp. mobilis ZM4 = ATCC 31821]|uniref:DUF465 domain-containing protein n=2 Tax=Zymomonas mobilis subsp. mobilis TaxID=120045 RepID=Q5NNU8_ZYMMO|nr:DUF465 domain-containing protein [Zymomonas mobilis]AAV89612.1 protein of unknown function DUF465 [Zymomonas mobilis subsp. mobilis ZM4 = ATCC 31821]ACV74865.1 protein of unknown function DUF465 [Zymomonas mobilis subsp. mobilis NCIMB 11163]AEH62168.1 protein of unknown function DUF465 [Zymomonas mobilis subsp. mobilis ATCC 10988]AFN56219.1 protein of unknown function DUF465 [Zymomonas mobilis subsp. mobilis ATCC 29191]AHB09653.1 putative small protein containing a coiled-coil domain [Zymom
MNNDAIREQLNLLRQEHRDLDIAIEALALNNPVEQLRLARMKKRKLRLKDEITLLEDRLVPDIIA